MVTDALKGYLQIANGLVDVSKERATSAVKAAAAQSPDLLAPAANVTASATATALSLAAQVQAAAEELMVTSRDNRALLVGLIRTEVERAVAALGFAKEADVQAVRHKVDLLEDALDEAEAGFAEEEQPSLRVALAPAKKVPAKKAAKKVPAKKTAKKTAKKVPAKKTAKKTAKKVPAKKSAKKTPANKTAKKGPAEMTAKAIEPVEAIEAIEAMETGLPAETVAPSAANPPPDLGIPE